MTSSTFRFQHLVLTVSGDSNGYEVLVEVDTEEAATAVPVTISTADGDIATVEL